METEAQGLLHRSKLDWRLLTAISPQDSFEDVVVIHFKGACETTMLDTPYPRADGPLGITHIADGHLLPFSDVECDKLRQILRAANMRFEAHERDLVFGRALGRVVAHELHHILEHSLAHSKTGFTRASLSPVQLTAEERAPVTPRQTVDGLPLSNGNGRSPGRSE